MITDIDLIQVPKFYTYVYYNPETLQPFYVGKGSNDRAFVHLNDTLETTINPHKCRTIKQLQNNGLEPIIKLFYTETEERAFELEDFLTHYWGIASEGGILTNGYHGGRGGWTGIPKSEDHKRKIGAANKIASQNPETFKRKSESAKGNTNGRFRKGVPCSEETKKKIGAKAKERLQDPTKHPMYGKSQSDSAKAAIGLANSGKIHTEEHRRKISESQKGKKQTDYQKEAVRNANSKKWKVIDPEGKETIITNLRQYCKDHNISDGNLISYGKTKGYKAEKIET